MILPTLYFNIECSIELLNVCQDAYKFSDPLPIGQDGCVSVVKASLI